MGGEAYRGVAPLLEVVGVLLDLLVCDHQQRLPRRALPQEPVHGVSHRGSREGGGTIPLSTTNMENDDCRFVERDPTPEGGDDTKQQINIQIRATASGGVNRARFMRCGRRIWAGRGSRSTPHTPPLPLGGTRGVVGIQS